MAEPEAERVVDIYTDGACSGNPGPGGWGAVLHYGTRTEEICGGEPTATTNNRMELMAPIMALESLTRPTVVQLHTDSTYVRDGITKWLPRWQSNGWQTTGKQPVKNADLWHRLDAATRPHQVQWHWIKGHAGHPDNERADQLAATGLRQARAATHPPVPTPTGRRTAPRTTAPPDTGDATAARQRCRATTRAGQPCSHGARPSGLCHLHDPAVQCGAVKKNEQRCTTPTGAGLCATHRAAADHDPRLF